jgi:carbon storage regulator
MLVLTREAGESIMLGSSDENCLVTVLKFSPNRRTISVLINQAKAARPGALEIRSVDIELEGSMKISDQIELTIVSLRDDKVRLGINAPTDFSVHRLEVYEAVRRENQKIGRKDDPDEGTAGSRVPKRPSPDLPTLDIRLDEPRPDDGGSE